MSNSFEPIIVEQTFNTSIQNVWDAITKVGLMRQWYFEDINSFEPVVGFETEFNVQSTERSFLHQWKVTEVVSRKKIAYNWKYDNYPGDSILTIELSKEDTQTRLKLTHKVIESFPQDIPEFKRESGVAGWNYFIKERLKGFLESTE